MKTGMNNKKNADAFVGDSTKDSVTANRPHAENIEKIEKEMAEFIASTPELKKKSSWKERLENARTACKNAGEKLYRASCRIDESLNGFRHVAEELATAMALLASLLHARARHAVYRVLGKTKKTYGHIGLDRRFENRVEGVFNRLTDFSFGKIFEDIRGKRRFINRKIDEFAQKKMAFGKKLESGLDRLIERFAADRKRNTVRIAAMACCLMLCCITVNAGTVYNYSYHDIQLGTVKNKTEVEQAVSQVKSEMPDTANVSVAVSAEPDVDITYERSFEFGAVVDSTEAVAEKIANLDELLADGYAINVDGVTVAMVDTEETANKILDTVKQSYCTIDEEQEAELKATLDKIAAATAEEISGDADPTVVVDTTVARNLVINDAVNNTAGVVSQTAAVDAADIAADAEALETSVKSTIINKLTFELVEKLDIDLAQFTGISKDSVQFIETVTIEPVKAKLSAFSDYDTAITNFIDEEGKNTKLTVATKELVIEEESIKYEIEYVEDDTLYEGQTEIMVPGVNGSQKVLYEITKANGEEAARTAIDKQVLTEPSPAKVRKGTKEKPACVATGKLQWPTTGKFSSGFGRRWGRLHGGVDICNSTGTPIYAADGGTVVFSGYNNNGYGYLVKIDHGNGLLTFYAHNSSLLVKEGDKVFKGQPIAKMGNTGRSTGTHLHYEVHLNGTKVDPMNYY